MGNERSSLLMTKTKFHLTMKIILVNYMFFSKLINDKKKTLSLMLNYYLYCYFVTCIFFQ